MYFLKKLLSHFLGFIIFFSILVLVGISLTKEIITYDNVHIAVEKSNYWEEIITKSSSSYSDIVMAWDYIEMDHIFNKYLIEKILYELKISNQSPIIDLNQLNKKIEDGIEKYYHNNINEENNISVDLNKEEIITQEDIDTFYKEIDKVFLEIENRTYIMEIFEIIYLDDLTEILIITIVISFVLIALINFNVINALLYTITPITINSIFCFALYSLTKKIQINSDISEETIAYIINKIQNVTLKYFLILLISCIIVIITYFIGRMINIHISHKTGKTTLDTIFDDYDSDRVVDEINREENE